MGCQKCIILLLKDANFDATPSRTDDMERILNGQGGLIKMRHQFIHGLTAFIGVFAFSLCACAQPPDYDFQWTTITDVNNPAYPGGSNGELAGRGSVPYQYRIGRLELTSAQFLEFVHTFW